MSKKDNEYYSDLAMRAVDDDELFRELYDKYFPIVYNLVYVRVRNPDTADDIVGEVFLKVCDNLEKFDKAKASFATWISRIAERICINFYRSRGRNRESDRDETFDPPIDENEQPEQKFLIGERNSELLKALSTLSRREQKIIELKFWMNMTNKEIGETLGLSPGNVGIIFFRASETLRKKLKNKI